MKKLIIGGIVFTIALLGVVYYSIIGQDAEALNEVGSNVNLYSAIAAVVIVAVSVAVVLKYVNQMQNDTASGEDSGHEWDGIREYKNELPTGWAVMFIVLIVWFIYYLLIAFPVGTYSQIGEYNDEVKAHKEAFEGKWENLDNDKLLAMGKSVFSVQCSPCHGVIGDGMSGKAEDLTKRSFTKSYVTKILKEGSSQLGYEGGMASGADLGVAASDFDALAQYIAGGLKGAKPAAFDTCAGCHGEKGEGMDMVAPSLISYNPDFVATLLAKGHKKGEIGMMPSFKGMLTDTQIKAVSTFVENLKQ